MASIRRILLYFLAVLFTATAFHAFAQNDEKGTHVVKKGETLYRISQMYGVTVEKLYQLNPEAREGLNEGQVLQLPVSKEDKEAIYHMVQSGQTLYSISREYGVTIAEIMKANSQIKSETEIAAGMIIRIPSRSGSAQSPSTGGAKPPVVIPSGGMTGLKLYTVPAGATIYSLLRQTGWTEAQLLHYNPQLKDGLKAGASILIPDKNITNNLAIGDTSGRGYFPVGDYKRVVLALPFASDNNQRFKMYYEGFLMSLLEIKKSGANIALHVVDCGDSELKNTAEELKALPKIDMIIGGVSDRSVNQLAEIARQKSATYVIPFTSRQYSEGEIAGMTVYQVNTPHAALYAEAAKKFVDVYRGYHVHFVNFDGDKNSKAPFVAVLKQEMARKGMTYSEASEYTFTTPDAVRQLSLSHDRVVVVPNSGSLPAANNTLYPIAAAADSLGVTNVTAFGYPEWQTYVQSIGKMMRGAEASFYTTFHADPLSNDYEAFEKEFRGWYGHGLGSTFPRYGILGYDTGKYFLTLVSQKGSTAGASRGIQSEFKFRKDARNPDFQSNLGVFFVKFNRSSGTRRY